MHIVQKVPLTHPHLIIVSLRGWQYNTGWLARLIVEQISEHFSKMGTNQIKEPVFPVIHVLGYIALIFRQDLTAEYDYE